MNGQGNIAEDGMRVAAEGGKAAVNLLSKVDLAAAGTLAYAAVSNVNWTSAVGQSYNATNKFFRAIDGIMKK